MLWDTVQPHNRLNHLWPRCLRKAPLIREDTGMPRDFYIRPWGFTSAAPAAKHSLRLKIKDAFHLQRVRFAFSSRADLQSSAEIEVVVSWNYSGIVQWTRMFPCHSCRILRVLNMLALNEHAKVSKIKANPKAPLLGFTSFKKCTTDWMQLESANTKEQIAWNICSQVKANTEDYEQERDRWSLSSIIKFLWLTFQWRMTFS